MSRPAFQTVPARLAVALLLTLSIFAVPRSAFAASAASAGVKPWSFVDITAEYVNGSTYCLVGGELPTATPLPAPVEVAVPASSTPQWVGEVVANDSSKDRELPYKIARRGTMDIYSFTLQGSNLGQVEAFVPGLIQPSGQEYTASIKWVAPSPVPAVRIAVQVPTNAEIVQAAPGALTASDSSGNKFYYKEVSNVKTGDTVSLDFVYSTQSAGTGSSGGSSGGGSTTLTVIIVVGLVAVAALIFAVWRQARRSADDD